MGHSKKDEKKVSGKSVTGMKRHMGLKNFNPETDGVKRGTMQRMGRKGGAARINHDVYSAIARAVSDFTKDVMNRAVSEATSRRRKTIRSEWIARALKHHNISVVGI